MAATTKKKPTKLFESNLLLQFNSNMVASPKMNYMGNTLEVPLYNADYNDAQSSVVYTVNPSQYE